MAEFSCAKSPSRITMFNVVWIVLAFFLNVFVEENSAASLRCYLDSFTNYQEADLSEVKTLITGPVPCIDAQKESMFLANGFGNNPDNGPAIKTLISSYITLNNTNVILINWSQESRGIGLGPLGYPSALKNSKTVGEELASALVELVGLGLSKNMHLIGHSLGAHLLGHCGREAMKQNLTIPWITALDPARPGFDLSPPYAPVDTTSATFVDVVHCDPGGYGLNRSTGHVDMWPNYEYYLNSTKRQPGCSRSLTLEELGSNGNRCSHDRCWQYYNQTLFNPELFKVGQASNFYEWVDQHGIFSSTTYLGPAVDKEKRGDFFCSTSDTVPWGLGDDGLVL